MEQIIKKYLAGNITASEQKELLNWIREDDHLTEFKRIKEAWKEDVIKEKLPYEYQKDWSKVQHNIHTKTLSELLLVRRTLKFFQYAAFLILFFSVPSIIYLLQPEKPIPQRLVYTTVAADYGQISKVVLSDSTIVWVNSGSRLTYNNQFSTTNRDLKLTGEAFFKVTRNEKIPLILNCEELQVKVLGTEFCVSAYPEDNNIKVVLEKGKVELSSSYGTKFRQDLKPGELASFSKDSKKAVISDVNTRLFTSWKDGLINIYNLPLNELVIKLEKRYNQKFEVDDAIKNLPYTFTIKNEDLPSILSLMEKITPISAIQRNNVIELKYNKK